MRIIGIDQSLTATGLVGPEASDVVVIRSRLDGPQRLIEIRDRVVDVCLAPDTAVIMEGFAYSKGARAHDAGGLGWILRVALFEAGVPYLIVSTNQIKKYATGIGNAPKPHVVSAVTHRTGKIWTSTDAVDGYVAWCIGRDLAGLNHPMGVLPKAHRAAIKDLAWPNAVGWGPDLLAAVR